MKKFVIFLVFCNQILASGLEESIRRFQTLKSEIDQSVTAIKSKCQEGENFDLNKLECRFSQFCKLYEKDLNHPIIYQSSNGEMLTNEPFFELIKELNQCLREKNKEEIAEKVKSYTLKYGKIHLKKIWDENQKLKEILKKNGEEAKLSRINQEILSIRLEDGISGGETDRWSEGTRGDRVAVLALAEKRTKIKLSPELKESLIKISTLLSNQQYKIEAKKMERKLFPELYSGNLFSDFDNFLDPEIAGSDKKLVENQKLYQKMAQKNYDLFLDSKKDLIAHLKSKTTPKNKEMMDRAIKKIELVKFQSPILSQDLIEHCKSPNAWFNSESNTVTMCPQWFTHPESDLRYTYLHELTHAIDSCHFCFGAKVKKTSTQVVPEGLFEIDVKMDRVKDSEGLVYGMQVEGLDSDDLAPVKYSEHPFLSTLECLKKEESVGARTPDFAKMKERLKKEKAILEKNGLKSSQNTAHQNLDHAIKNFDKFKEYFKGCDEESFSGPNQLGESISDKLAFDILAEKYSKMPKADATEEIKKLLLTAMKGESIHGCPNNYLASKLEEKLKDEDCPGRGKGTSDGERVLSGLKTSLDNEKDEHPETFRRFERILMANPKIQSILGCIKDERIHCE